MELTVSKLFRMRRVNLSQRPPSYQSPIPVPPRVRSQGSIFRAEVKDSPFVRFSRMTRRHFTSSRAMYLNNTPNVFKYFHITNTDMDDVLFISHIQSLLKRISLFTFNIHVTKFSLWTNT